MAKIRPNHVATGWPASPSYKAQLEGLAWHFEDQVEVLAEEYRTYVLLPLCRKKQLTYNPGGAGVGGTFYELRRGGEVVEPWEHEKIRRLGLKRVLDTLDQPVHGDKLFGNYVEDISALEV